MTGAVIRWGSAVSSRRSHGNSLGHRASVEIDSVVRSTSPGASGRNVAAGDPLEPALRRLPARAACQTLPSSRAITGFAASGRRLTCGNFVHLQRLSWAARPIVNGRGASCRRIRAERRADAT